MYFMFSYKFIHFVSLAALWICDAILLPMKNNETILTCKYVIRVLIFCLKTQDTIRQITDIL
jgi:hypothetical protein